NGLPSLFLLGLGNQIIHLWIGSSITASFLLLLGLAIWNIILGVNVPIAMLLNGANIIGFQVVTVVIMTVSNVLVSIFLTHQIGVSGVVWGSIIPQTIFVLTPSLIYIPRFLSRTEQKHAYMTESHLA